MSGKQSKTTGKATGETTGKTPGKTTKSWSDDMPRKSLQDRAFDYLIKNLAGAISSESSLRRLGVELGLKTPDIELALEINRDTGKVSSEGSGMMLQKWMESVEPSERMPALRSALKKADLGKLEEMYLPRESHTENRDPVRNMLMGEWNLDLMHHTFARYFFSLEILGKDAMRKGSLGGGELGTEKSIGISTSSHLAAVGLFTLQNLRSLMIHDVDLDDDFCKGMCAAASQSKIETFTHRMDSMTPLGPDASLHYARGLFSMPNLKSLDLVRLDLSDEYYTTLATEASKSKIQRLYMEEVSMTQRILHTILSLKHLQCMKMSKMDFVDKHDEEMLIHKTSTVDKLYLDGRDVTSLWKLGLHTSCPQLQTLNLDFGYRENVSSDIVTKACSPFHHLTHLHIEGRKGTLDPESFSIAVITSCPQLSKLSINYLDLHNEKATEIIGSMKTHPHLTNLELLGCGSDMHLDPFIAKVNSEGKLTVTATQSQLLIGDDVIRKWEERERERERRREWRKKMPSITKKSSTSMQESSSVSGEGNVTPIKMECRKSVGVEGGKLQVDSFGIELEIPPGAVDSETPQDVALRVLTDTPNLGDSKDEISVCFGVQCLAPDDLDLKLPVIYTIPHCAVMSRYSSAEAVLYTGEGEYTPDAVIKERIVLSRSGIPSCTVMKDVLKLQMNHFSWAKIKLRIKNFFFRGKRMCCQPFADKNLPAQKAPVILRAHLYEDIPGNREVVESQEKFASVHPEGQVLIKAVEDELRMTCYVKEKIVGGPAVVSFERLNSGNRICEPFTMDFTDQSDIVAVSLKVELNKKLEVNLTFPLKFPTCLRAESDSSQTLRTSHRTSEENPENRSGEQDDFEEKMTIVARKVVKRDEIDKLGKALGFDVEDIERFVATNMKGSDVSYMGTLSMLRKWRRKQKKSKEHEALDDALWKAEQIHLADELFGTEIE